MRQQSNLHQTDDQTQTRYSRQAVREILARASEIETPPDADNLTAQQIEILGEELGIAPHAVRRALSEKTPRPDTATVAVPQAMSQSPATVGQIIATPLPALVYTGSLTALFYALYPTLTQDIYASPMQRNWLYLLLFSLVVVLPLILAGRAGFYLRHRRQGMIAGFLLASGAIIAPMISLGLTGSKWGDYTPNDAVSFFLTIFACFTWGLVGLMYGLTGANKGAQDK